MKTDPKSYILHLTVEEFIEVLKDNLPASSAQLAAAPAPTDSPAFTGRIIYGIIGLERFFNISHKTACEWKKTWLAPAVKQEGRKIMTDAEYALKLYGEHNRKA